MLELLKKKYNIELEFFGLFGRPKKVSFQYKQGTLRELLELQESINKDRDLRKTLFDFLKNKTKRSKKFTRRMFHQMHDKRMGEVMDFVLDTYAKGFFTKTDQPSEKSFKNIKSPTSSAFCVIFEKTGESLDSLLKMTWEQIEFLMEGVSWNLNSMTKEGQKKNETEARMKMLQEEISDEDALKMARKLEEKKRLSDKNKVNG